MSLPVMITTHDKQYFINKRFTVIIQSDFSFFKDSKNKLKNAALSQEEIWKSWIKN